MFRIDMLPAEFGDALWIEYGQDAVHRILIDCGTRSVFEAVKRRIEALPVAERHFELFVVTHVDVDHIGGALELLRQSKKLGVTFGEIWFNGYVHLSAGGVVPKADDTDILGPLQGEELTSQIVNAGPGLWNKAFGGAALVVPEAGALPCVKLPGGMSLTLLSPMQAQLDRLKPVWEAACAKAGLVPGAATDELAKILAEPLGPDAAEEDDLLGELDPELLAASRFKPDGAIPNGSSIALLAEYDGRRAVLAADAYAPVVQAALARVPERGQGKLKVHAFKAAHHGSRGNTSLPLVQSVECGHWLISSNGKQFKHPDIEAIGRIIHGSANGVCVHFNYKTEFNDVWSGAALQEKFRYVARYPAGDGVGISLVL